MTRIRGSYNVESVRVKNMEVTDSVGGSRGVCGADGVLTIGSRKRKNESMQLDRRLMIVLSESRKGVVEEFTNSGRRSGGKTGRIFKSLQFRVVS